MSLKEYQRKRKFDQTPEPRGKEKSGKGLLTFVIQKHEASRTHYDFRLEMDGVLKSWAVPKGPTLTSQDPRLAVHVEDHPLEYGKFEGVIPRGNYGAGTVMVWDKGHYRERTSLGRKDSEKALKAGMAKGHITFTLHGEKLKGEFALIKLKKKGAPENGWLLIKKHDEFASRQDILKEDRSVRSGRTMKEITAEAPGDGDVWLPKKGNRNALKKATFKKGVSPKPERAARESKDPFPHRIRVMQPVSVSKAPEGGEWLFESLGEGLRAVAEVSRSGVKLYSKMFLSYERKFPAIVSALKSLGVEAVFDGEILQKGKPTYSIGDLLYLNGKDLRGESLQKRKELLSQISLNAPLKHSDSNSGRFQVAKNLTSSYKSGLSRDWVKIPVTSKVKVQSTASSDNPPITHPNKIFWPEEGYTKNDLIKYYDSIADYILPYLKDRPESLNRQPDGIKGKGFFHKDMQGYLPKRIETTRVYSGSAQKTVHYLLCQDKWTLLYLINLGCIELNPWLSRKDNLEKPDFVVIDLDPDDNTFEEVIEVAQEVRRVLEAVGAQSFCKTSGGTGLHICVPTGGKYDFDTCRLFAEEVCKKVQTKFPKNTSLERTPAKRRRKIYLDYLQNRRGQTLAAPYCVRPRPKAPVSMPLKWSEVKKGLRPESFTIENALTRLKKVGDLWKPILNTAVNIEKCLKQVHSFKS